MSEKNKLFLGSDLVMSKRSRSAQGLNEIEDLVFDRKQARTDKTVDLPDDIWIEILLYLALQEKVQKAIRDLFSIGMTSSQLEHLSTQMIRLHFSDFKSRSNALLLKFLDTQEIELGWEERNSFKILPRLTQLTKLKLTYFEYGLLPVFHSQTPQYPPSFLDNLVSLRLPHNFPLSEDVILKLSHLTHFHGPYPTSLTHLSNLISLKFSIHPGTATDQIFSSSNFTKLQKLNLGNFKYSPEAWDSVLSPLINLTYLTVGDLCLVSSLKKLPLLKKLGCMNRCHPIQTFKELTGLTSLSINDGELDTSGILLQEIKTIKEKVKEKNKKKN